MDIILEVLGTAALTLCPFFGPPLIAAVWKAMRPVQSH